MTAKATPLLLVVSTLIALVAVVLQPSLLASILRVRRMFPSNVDGDSCPFTRGDIPIPPNLPTMPLRVGILGASAIARHAVITPVSFMDPHDVVVAGVAARDVGRAERYAQKHGSGAITKVYPTYDELIRSDDIDAVYIGIPTLYHHKYALASIRAGKHVLLEKPATVSGSEADELLEEAKNGDVVLVEAFHYRFHPLFRRVQDLVRDGAIGKVTGYDVSIAMPSPADIWRSSWLGRLLSGGPANKTETTDHEHRKMLDRWSYGLDAVLAIAGDEVSLAVQKASLTASVADIVLDISNDGEKASIPAHIHATKERLAIHWDLKVVGDRGSIEVTNFWFPSLYHSLRVTSQGANGQMTTRIEKHYGEGDDYGATTFEYQLSTFVNLCSNVKSGKITSFAAIGTTNMKVVDAIFESAGVGDLTLQNEQ